MFGLIPIHFFVPCEASCNLVGIASLLFIAVGGLTIVAHKYSLFVWAVAPLVLNSLSMH